MQQAAGRLNWATMIYNLMRPFLQPIFAWVAAMVQRQGRQPRGRVTAIPPQRVRLVAATLLHLFSELPPATDLPQNHTTTMAASDAGARPTVEGHEAMIGGWYGPPTDTQWDKHWFYIRLSPTQHPWAYEKGNPQLHIASMELYGTLLLFRTMLGWPHETTSPSPRLDVSMQISLNTDNRGNSYQATNQKSKNNTAANMLMELALLQHNRQCRMHLQHVYREHNQWADQLTHANTAGFNPMLEQTPDEALWYIMDQL